MKDQAALHGKNNNTSRLTFFNGPTRAGATEPHLCE